jgi:hypothetical protein
VKILRLLFTFCIFISGVLDWVGIWDVFSAEIHHVATLIGAILFYDSVRVVIEKYRVENRAGSGIGPTKN